MALHLLQHFRGGVVRLGLVHLVEHLCGGMMGLRSHTLVTLVDPLGVRTLAGVHCLLGRWLMWRGS